LHRRHTILLFSANMLRLPDGDGLIDLLYNGIHASDDAFPLLFSLYPLDRSVRNFRPFSNDIPL
jgi:hypothetical protein